MVFFAVVLRITVNYCFHSSNFFIGHVHVGIRWRDFTGASPSRLTSLLICKKNEMESIEDFCFPKNKNDRVFYFCFINYDCMAELRSLKKKVNMFLKKAILRSVRLIWRAVGGHFL